MCLFSLDWAKLLAKVVKVSKLNVVYGNSKLASVFLSLSERNCFVLAKAVKARHTFVSCLEKGCDKKSTEIASVGFRYPIECNKSRDRFVNQCRYSWEQKGSEALDDKGDMRGGTITSSRFCR
ncbi:unnamed protein product [Vicia faba]|uniref:Uncharacterized protein n=1 Tax=Vicia faba TaxID=3906 RepID=A0AAV0ZS13_VICFA|nr:unnamed protein product [Vicia faba]